MGIAAGVGIGLLIVAGAAGGGGAARLRGGGARGPPGAGGLWGGGAVGWGGPPFWGPFWGAFCRARRLPVGGPDRATPLADIGRTIGGLFESTNPRAGVIVDGCATVFVGEAPRRGAFRSSRARVSCHVNGFVAQGSDSVFYENKNASRVRDRTSCTGTISEGV